MYARGRFLTRLGLLSALAAAAACSGEDFVDADGDGVADGVQVPNNVTVITPTRPQGHVAGEIRDALNDEPLAGVTIEISGGGIPAGIEASRATDASGTFEIGPIAAGAAFTLRFAAEGYADVVLPNLVIDDTAGDFPVINGALFIGPLRLLRAESSFSVQVVSSDGGLVQGARVTVETAARYLMDRTPQGTAHGVSTTGADGRATIEGLPNVWALPPSLEAAGGVTISVDAVDVDGDGRVDWAGATRTLSGRQIREGGAAAQVVLGRPVTQALAVVASNVAGLVAGNAAPSVLAAAEPIRVVLNKEIDRESVVVDLRDETGLESVTSVLLVAGFENVLEIDAAEGLQTGREYNLALRIQALDSTPLDVLEIASPVFVRDERDRAITVTGRFVDKNGDLAWGNGIDQIEIDVSTPVGRALAVPAFSVELYLDLDLNGTSTVGDAAGELPRGGRDYPAPIVLDAAEPVPPNGAGRSGFTRFLAERRINLPEPLANTGGTVAFELRFTPARNAGRFVATPGGRQVPERLSGSLSFMTE